MHIHNQAAKQIKEEIVKEKFDINEKLTNTTLEAIEKTYKEYLDRTSKISKDKDSFFDAIGEFKEPEEDKIFDMKKRQSKADKESFFKDF